MAEENGTQDQQQQQSQIAARPEWLPEKFYDPATGQARTEDLAKSFTHIEKKFGEGKTAYDAERLKGRPEKADGYSLKFDAAKLPAGLVLLDKAPGDDFRAEAGKSYFVLQDDPLMQFWRQHCWENGLSQDTFAAGIMTFAKTNADAVPTEQQIAEFRRETYSKLGEHGEQRVQHAWGRLQHLLGDKASALDNLVDTSEGIEALELLLEKAGEPKFSPGAGAADAAGAASAAQEIKKLEADPEFQKKILDRNHPEHKDAFGKLQKLHEQAARAA